MNVSQVLVDRDVFRDVASNANKLAALSALLPQLANADKSDLVVLPAGYLTASKPSDITPLVTAVASEAKRAGVAVAFGVDLRVVKNPKKQASPKRIRTGGLPYWVVAVGSNGATLGQWQQQSVRAADAATAPPLNASSRLVHVASKTVAVLACGEIFNANYRAVMRAQPFDVLVDLGHCSMGTGVIPALTSIVGSRQRWAVHTHHVKVGQAKALAIDANGTNSSAPSFGQWRTVQPGGVSVFTHTRTI